MNTRLGSSSTSSRPYSAVVVASKQRLPLPSYRAGSQRPRLRAAGTEFLTPAKEIQDAIAQGLKEARSMPARNVQYQGIHHVGLLVEDLERSLQFYEGVLGLEVNPARPHNKLPYAGAWLWIGSEMIHLMQLPNPDTLDPEQRPQHGGRDRHFCIGVQSIDPLIARLDQASVPYTKSMSGRPAVFFRDPDMNVLEIGEMGVWHA